MSLATGYPWTHQNIRLVGNSLAGITTSIAMPDAGAVFDVAQGLPWQVPIPNILLTHGHMDHASGIPYLIGQKAMSGQSPPTIFMPPALVPQMRELMRIWERIEDHTYQYQFIAVEVDREYPLKPPYFFKAFPTFHRVPSVGYTIFERKKRLRDELRGLDREALVELRRKRVEIEEHWDEPLVTFTGDTRIEFIDSRPWIKQSKVLLTEVTFIDKSKTIENAREWGHLHLEELLPRLPDLKCERIVLIHISARYTTRRILEVLDDRIPEHFKTRIQVFPRPL